MEDLRRHIPRTDALLEELSEAVGRFGRERVKRAVVAAQAEARAGRLAPEDVRAHAETSLRHGASLTPVLNATGVVVHTNLGRSPLSAAAVDGILQASGYVDVELDLASGTRSRSRGAGALAALRAATPGAEDVLVVNNGAAALSLVVTCLARDSEVVVSRGELVEIGDGFRLPELITATGPRLREVGTTNRTHLADYVAAVGEQTGCVLKVHPSNFRVEGFVADVPVSRLAALDPPLVVDIGSGLLEPDPLLPDEPSAAQVLAEGADLVTASGDKLLGGPQSGLVLGRSDLVERVRRHPLARAMRVDKLTLAALEATLLGPEPPVTRYRRLSAEEILPRTRTLSVALEQAGVPVTLVPCESHVGGGGAPGVPLPGWALALPEDIAEPLRTGSPAVLARISGGRCLVDLRCIPEAEDDRLRTALVRAHAATREDATTEHGVAR